MRFKTKENALMWERYMGDDMPTDSFEEFEFNDDIGDDHQDDSHSAVIEFEPMGDMDTEEHHHNEVIYSDIKKLAEYSKRMLDICSKQELDTWMQAKLVKASDYVSEVWHRLDAEADFANTGYEQSDNIDL